MDGVHICRFDMYMPRGFIAAAHGESVLVCRANGHSDAFACGNGRVPVSRPSLAAVDGRLPRPGIQMSTSSDQSFQEVVDM